MLKVQVYYKFQTLIVSVGICKVLWQCLPVCGSIVCDVANKLGAACDCWSNAFGESIFC